jgi:hypothetical protein
MANAQSAASPAGRLRSGLRFVETALKGAAGDDDRHDDFIETQEDQGSLRDRLAYS